ncbi:MAG: hypothetical protein QOD85_1420, partial [Gaiellaceae bacterium]|nr:hypothetical protein [Gaiellaceae bacterium]
ALAQHWREAGDDAKAAEYFAVAAEQAGRGWAKEEAVDFYGQALVLIGDSNPELRRTLTLRQAVAAAAVLHLGDAKLLGRRAERADQPQS